jgi:hypothetical protein
LRASTTLIILATERTALSYLRGPYPWPLNALAAEYNCYAVENGRAYEPGFGLLAALPPPLFMSPAKKEARASFWVDLPSGVETWPGVVGSGVW